MADKNAWGYIPSVESSPPITFGGGLTLRFYYTPSYPDDSPYKRYTETTYDPSLPGAKPLNVPGHWHANHDEYLSIVEGEMDAWIGYGPTVKHVLLKPGVDAAYAPRRTVHAMKGRAGVKTVLREGTSFGNVRTKESFLRHFASSQSSWIGARASFEGDAYSPFPILGYRNEAFEMTVVTLLGGMAALFKLAPPPPVLPDEKSFMQKKQ